MVSKTFMEFQFKKAGLEKGSKDHTQFEVGMEIIKEKKPVESIKKEMIRILREFVEI